MNEMMAVIRRLLFLCLVVFMASWAHAADATPNVTLDTSEVAPRALEDTTVSAVTRDYAAAWAQFAAALEQNRRDLLDTSFVGIAHDSLGELVSSQQRSGLRQRYVDNGHKLKAVFYSADGSALEIHDTAQLQFQLLDRDKVVFSQNTTMSYVVILTPAENRWKIRVLQSVNPNAR